MNCLALANEIIAEARSRRPGCCVPGTATSPADRLGTVRLSADLIAECDRGGQVGVGSMKRPSEAPTL
ncbi:MAG: hypothetical protein M3Y35_03640 [Actinomycetota bacterium]|nr:hypothetical protein [Actinomycetota bacterium]